MKTLTFIKELSLIILIEVLAFILKPFFYDYKGFFMDLFDADSTLHAKVNKFFLNALITIGSIMVFVFIFRLIEKL